MEAAPRRGDGFTQRDFALRNASWLISDIFTDRHAAEGRREGFQAPLSNDAPIAPEAVARRRPGGDGASGEEGRQVLRGLAVRDHGLR
jgi:epoxyqueuosine reductase